MFPVASGGSASGNSYKGEYSSDVTYSAGDLVTCNGILYKAKQDNPSTPPDNDMMSCWEQLSSGGSGSGGSGSESLVTLKGGTYTLNTTSPYNSKYGVHPYRYDITESVSGTFTKGTESGMFSRIKLTGVGGNSCPDAPYTYATFYDSSDNLAGSLSGMDSAGTDWTCSITIGSDTQVSSLFYSVLMGMMA